jgi:hypothetical protein
MEGCAVHTHILGCEGEPSYWGGEGGREERKQRERERGRRKNIDIHIFIH